MGLYYSFFYSFFISYLLFIILFIIYFIFSEYQLYYKTAGHLVGGGSEPLHPPPRSAPAIFTL